MILLHVIHYIVNVDLILASYQSAPLATVKTQEHMQD